MDEIFGARMEDIMLGVVVALAVVGAFLAVLAFRHPLLFRLGLRNVPRRKAQTSLIIFGLMLSTLIISSAFTTGDTLSSSLRNTAFQITGAIDHLIQYDTDPGRSVSSRDSVVPQQVVDDLKAEFADDPQIVGFLRALSDTVSMFDRDTGQLLPISFLLGLDAAELDAVGGIPAVGGGRLNLDVLGERGIILNQSAARELAAEVGHTVEVSVLREAQEFVVVAIARDTLVSGEVNPTDAQGAVIRLADAQTLFDREGVVAGVGVTTTGGVRGALAISDEVDQRLNAFLQERARAEVAAGVPVAERVYADAQDRAIFVSDPFKQDTVDNAEQFGSIITSLFLVMGLFSIGAGVLLIFLIFVLLAEERKTEMGISRAVGMRRWNLVETYLAEGSAYTVGSAVVGAVLGILVAFGMVEVLNSLGDEFGFTFTRRVEPRSLVVSAGIGIVLTFLTVSISAYRVSNLNIVAAIRDIPENSIRRRRRISVVGMLTTLLGLLLLPTVLITAPIGLLATVLPGLSEAIRRRGWAERVVLPAWSLMRWRPEWWFALLVVGALFFLNGISSETAFLYLLGFSLFPVALLLLGRRLELAGRTAHSLMGVAILLIWLAPFRWHEALFGFDGEGGFELFFLSGAMMVTGGTVLVVFNLDVLADGLRRLSVLFGRLRPVLQTAAAYPATARFRTGMTVAMIAIIMFALVMFTTINANFERLFTSDTAAGGYDIQADANRNALFTDLRTALVDAGREDVAAQLEDVSTLALASFFGTDIVLQGYNRWDEGAERLVLDDTGQPIAEEIEPELAETALDAEGNPLPGAAMDPANFIYKAAFFVGADDAFLTTNEVVLQTRAPGFDSDAAVWQALGTPLPDGSRYGVISAQAVSEAGGPFGDADDDAFQLPDFIEEETERMPEIRVLVRNPATGAQLQVRIIGVLDQVIQIAGPEFSALSSLIVARPAVNAMFPDPELVRNFAKVTPGSDPLEVARAVEATLRVETVSIIDKLKEDQDTFRTILTLFQAFTGLGLLAGLAALGVVAVRAVVERRQQIGMLRAIGFSRGFVRLAMMLEMGFIAGLGVVLGTALAVVLAWRLFDEGAFGSTSGAAFYVPVVDVVVFIAIAMVASLLLTYLPSRQAGSTTIAESLRYE